MHRDSEERKNLVGPEPGQKGNMTVSSVEVQWMQRAGQEGRTCQGLTPLHNCLQLLVPGESPGWLACVTLGKSLPTSEPRFPLLQKEQDGSI